MPVWLLVRMMVNSSFSVKWGAGINEVFPLPHGKKSAVLLRLTSCVFSLALTQWIMCCEENALCMLCTSEDEKSNAWAQRERQVWFLGGFTLIPRRWQSFPITTWLPGNLIWKNTGTHTETERSGGKQSPGMLCDCHGQAPQQVNLGVCWMSSHVLKDWYMENHIGVLQ